MNSSRNLYGSAGLGAVLLIIGVVLLVTGSPLFGIALVLFGLSMGGWGYIKSRTPAGRS